MRIILLSLFLVLAGISVTPAADAQAEPSMTIIPASGPCDAVVTVIGEGFEAGVTVPLDLASPHSGVSQAKLAEVSVATDGTFTVDLSFGQDGCDSAALDVELDDPGEPAELAIWAGYDSSAMRILARATYIYTTTRPGERPDNLPNGGGQVIAEVETDLIELSLSLAAVGLAGLAVGLWTKWRLR